MCKQIIVVIAVLFMTAGAAAAPAAYPVDLAARTSILVLPFEYKGAGGGSGAMADDYLMEEFARLNRFTMVEREKLDKVLLEQKLSREKLTRPEQSLMLGRLLSADQMISGSIQELRGETVVTMRVVATATSAVRDYSVAAATSGMREFRRLITDIAARVAGDFPVLEGKISSTAGGAYTAQFASPGLRNGLEAVIYRWGDAVRHPTTGRELGRKAIRIASGTINGVAGTTCSITVSRTEKGRTVKAGDLIITR